jgi:hypothetical protein
VTVVVTFTAAVGEVETAEELAVVVDGKRLLPTMVMLEAVLIAL